MLNVIIKNIIWIEGGFKFSVGDLVGALRGGVVFLFF